MTEAWQHWEGQIVEGKFPLRRYLGGSADSAVYLTESVAGESQSAAIKLIAADAATTEARLARWRLAAKLSHPHLVRIFEVGACQIETVNLLYLVMECAEEDLSQILPVRPLTPAESRDMLDPVLETLAYLHSRRFIHSRLKPANIMAVDNRLKISSDGLCPAGESTAGFGKPSVYDSPEAANGEVSPAADVWSLGVTLVDVLTQRLPQKNGQGEPLRLEALPEPFLEIVRHCLRRDPQQRWTVDEITAYLQISSGQISSGQISSGKTIEPVAHSPEPGLRWRLVGPAAAVVVAALVVAGVKLSDRNPGDQSQNVQLQQYSPSGQNQTAEPAADTARPEPAVEAAATPAGTNEKATQTARPENASRREAPKVSDSAEAPVGDIVHQVLPDVSRQARLTITGKVKVKVRVHVDSSGNVTEAVLDSAGPSEYFSRRSLQAAREWKFVPESGDAAGSSRQWELRFEFSRSGARVVPARVSR